MRDLCAHWPKIEQCVAEATQLLVMLDFDGTLSPIVERPEDAAISAENRARLQTLATCPNSDRNPLNRVFWRTDSGPPLLTVPHNEG